MTIITSSISGIRLQAPLIFFNLIAVEEAMIVNINAGAADESKITDSFSEKLFPKISICLIN